MDRLTAARVTAKAKHATANRYRWSTATGNDCFLAQVTAPDQQQMIQALNTAARYLRGQGYEATVVTSRSRSSRTDDLYMVKVVDTAAQAERIAAQAAARTAALEAAAVEVEAGRRRDAIQAEAERTMLERAAALDAMPTDDEPAAECVTCTATVPGEACFGCGTVTPAVSVTPPCRSCGEGAAHPGHGGRLAHSYDPAPRTITPAAGVLPTQAEVARPATIIGSGPSYGCVQHIERGPECGPECDRLTAAWVEPRPATIIGSAALSDDDYLGRAAVHYQAQVDAAHALAQRRATVEASAVDLWA